MNTVASEKPGFDYDPTRGQYFVNEPDAPGYDNLDFNPAAQSFDSDLNLPDTQRQEKEDPFHEPMRENLQLWTSQDYSKSYTMKEIQSFLQNITYTELPGYVRAHFEKRFQHALSDPKAREFVEAVKINFKPRGAQGQDSEYFRDKNLIEWYHAWPALAKQQIFPRNLYSPERVRQEFILEFLNRTIAHELAHSLQNYYQNKAGVPHPSVAPYPNEDHPEYYDYGKVYQEDPGEMQAREVARSLHVPTNEDHKRYYSLNPTLKLSWEVEDSTPKTDRYGNTYWHNSAGQLHRTDGPAVELADGYKAWYVDGKLHRTDGPAVEWADGRKEWYVDGKRHRTDGPAIELADGYKAWYVDGKLHRTDGPAIEYADGDKEWWVNGKLHRTDGPAVEYANGGKAWWVNGRKLTEAQFNRRRQASLKLAAPETYTDVSDVAMSDKKDYDNRALENRTEDHLDLARPEQMWFGEPTPADFEPTQIIPELDDKFRGYSDVARSTSLYDLQLKEASDGNEEATTHEAFPGTAQEGHTPPNEGVSQESEETQLGEEGEIVYPTVEEIVELHDQVLQQYGGLPGLRVGGEGLLEAAIGRMQSGFGETELYPELADKAAALIHSIITTHPFNDGNKRTALMAGIYFLHIHGFSTHDSDELAELIIAVADDKASLEDLRHWIDNYTKHMFEHHDEALRLLS
jgi:death-on-curing family protein